MRSSRACSMFFTAGTPNFHMTTSSTRNASEPQMISFGSGTSGFGAFWQSSTVLPSSSSLWHSSAALLGEVRLGLLRERRRGREHHDERDAGDCNQHTDASTHRSSCPGFSPR